MFLIFDFAFSIPSGQLSFENLVEVLTFNVETGVFKLVLLELETGLGLLLYWQVREHGYRSVL